MECNKEEAIRAKEIAEKKMQNGDFLGAQKFALKAQQLYPDIDNISQLLLVCEVHCSAENKLNGSEMDWYGILQVERFSDETVVKKQYRKLALSLHPDKNKFAGAEAAFKLIGEANRMLTDPTKRHVYDVRCRGLMRSAAQKPVPHQSNRNSLAKKQYEAMNKSSSSPYSQHASLHAWQQSQQLTFWTCCSSCGIRYQYYREFINKVLRCQSCQHNFLASDLGIQSMPSGASWSEFRNQQSAPNHGPSKVVPKSSVKPGGMKASTTTKARKTGHVSGNSEPEVPKFGNDVETGGNSKQQEKSHAHVEAGMENEGVAMPKPDKKIPKESETSKSASRKRGRMAVDDSSESYDTGSTDENEENVVMQENGNNPSEDNRANGGHQPRRSSRLKQNISYKENLSDEDNDFDVSTPKKAKINGSSSATELESGESSVNGGVLKEDGSGANEAKQKASSAIEENLSTKKRNTAECLGKKEEGSMLPKADKELDKSERKFSLADECKPGPDNALESEVWEYPDPDFSDFDKDKAENVFAVNQLWAIYDPADGMPRFYALVKKVFAPGFKLQITWLEASSDEESEQKWSDADLPIGCGKYEIGGTQKIDDHLMFSHQMHYIRVSRRGTYVIYPKKGETWAIFKDWDIKWCSEPEKHGAPYQFEFVEVVGDFDEKAGIEVAYLGKVNGFVSIFQQAAHDGILKFCIPPVELYRFSHRIPSFRMTGKEGQGVPAGSFELDPVSLPSYFYNLGDCNDAKREKEKLDAGANDSCSKSPENIVNLTKGFEKITPKKNEIGPNGTVVPGLSARESDQSFKNGNESDVCGAVQCMKEDCNKDENHGNLGQPKVSAPCWANEKFKTPRKRQKNEYAADAFKPRRSPRDLSKNSNQVNGSQFMTKEDIDKDTITKKDDNHGKPSASLSHSDGKIHTKAASSTSSPKSSVSSGRRVIKIQVDKYNFTSEKSEDKFLPGQIWSLYSDKDGLPRNYAQIKKIDHAPDFKLRVAMLKPCPRLKDAMQSICCGIFEVEIGRTNVFPVTKFSHQLEAESVGKNRYEIYPRKGEIWAVFKNRISQSTCSDHDNVEYDIVEVLEANDHSVKVVVMQREPVVSGFFYRARRIQRSQTGVMDILRSEYGRFSHQCCAVQMKEEKDGALRGYWEVDPTSIPRPVIHLD